jgi:Arc/MetJ-type ribon-helix-helix transcriptional regulator
MAITLRPDHEQRFLDAVQAGGFESTDDAMDTALEMLRSQNEWLLENRKAIDAKIQQGIAELDRGEGIPEDELDAHLDKLKAERE